MTGPVTPAAIASVVMSQSISRQEAADLIQHYADEYARVQVQKALEEQAVRYLNTLHAPLTRTPS